MAKRAVDSTHLGNSYSPDLMGNRDLSVFSIDLHWRRDGRPLPSILITEPTVESKALEESDAMYEVPYGGRFPVLLFPEDAPEPLGPTARTFAAVYVLEGTNASARNRLGKRIDCFRVAELLYLHAIAYGDVKAHVGLGNLYARDRCEGHYFEALGNNLLANQVLPPERIRRKAYEHFLKAHEAGEVEGTYMLGDMLRDGIGCSVDLGRAFGYYRSAYDRICGMASRSTFLLGCAALRLGRAFEEGEGCDYDFAEALRLYETAAECLEDIVEKGAWQYGVDLGNAKRGVLRMHQELSLA